VKLDAYAVFDLRREHRLSTSEWPLLTALTLLASHRNAQWEGTIAELAGMTGMGTKTVVKSLDSLRAAGLIEFGGFGRRSIGAVRVLAYDALVVPERRDASDNASNDASERSSNRVDVASLSRRCQVK
jgi:hypothetical protein